MLNNTFYRFLFGFAAIIAVAFGILSFANSQMPQAVDTVAHPR